MIEVGKFVRVKRTTPWARRVKEGAIAKVLDVDNIEPKIFIACDDVVHNRECHTWVTSRDVEEIG